MLKQRVITAVIGIPLLMAVSWFGEPWFTLVMAIWGVLAVLEFYKLVAVSAVSPLIYFGLIWTLLFILIPHFDYEIAMAPLLASTVLLPLIWLMLRPQKGTAFARWVWTIAGIFYVGWLLSYLVALRNIDLVNLEIGRSWVFFTLFTNYGSDTAAFFIGRAFGRHHLAPSISPGKTKEGAVGGVFGAIVVSLGVVALFDLPLGYGQAVLLGFLVSIMGQLGDLVESMFKRNVGVKESGKMLPGHGGLLDRMDSLIFAGVTVYYYVLLFVI
jgi:phosphatidate cytidylyltransferase